MIKISNYDKGFTLIRSGFTLIELLVVISIIGILIGLSVLGLQGARQSSRDATRKADLELIRSGLEIYKADCGAYPVGTSLASPLKGTSSTGTCLNTNTYISTVPTDPQNPVRSYSYSSNGTTYALCTSLENAPSPAENTTGCGTCGTSSSCNHKVTNP